jgi:cell division protein ZapA (FtsZ GTPase activity inhibitor)
MQVHGAMSTDRKSIRVKIFGSEYPLRGDSEEFTRRVASHVDNMINSIHKKIPEQPTLTVAVLSALNITEDLLKEREKTDGTRIQIENELSKLSAYLDGCLRDS